VHDGRVHVSVDVMDGSEGIARCFGSWKIVVGFAIVASPRFQLSYSPSQSQPDELRCFVANILPEISSLVELD